MNIQQPTGVSLSGSRHVSIFKGRYKYIYGVDGGGRGFRWDGVSTVLQPMGMRAPTAAATFAQSSATTSFVASVQVVNSGVGYFMPPTVAFKGGGLTDGDPAHAKGFAQMRGAGVGAVVITSAGTGYTSAPTIEFSGGRGSGASLSLGYSGGVGGCIVTSLGAGYTSGATIGFSGVSGAVAVVDTEGDRVTGVRILNAGTGATTTAAGTIYGISGGTGAAVQCVMSYGVDAVTVTSGGTSYAGSVPISFSPASGGAAGYLTATTTGALTSPVITSRGSYAVPPTASVSFTGASAVALIRPPMKGNYRFAYRYIDDTPVDDGGPIPSDISPLVTVEAPAGAGAFVWTWDNANADARASAVELFRTSADQALVLYRVAVLPKVGGALPTTYTDTLSDAALLDPSRTGYGYMPITLPSGQLNANRFGVAPGTFADACWFQDRAWFGADTSGAQPNVLKFSEIDEAESVPDSNEIVVQENTGDQDAVVALIPFGSMLVVAQSRHMYRLTYVSQPVIDASVTLLGYRGLLNKRCWSAFEGTVFCVDSFGMYAFDGSAMEPVSIPVDDYWREGKIDFSQKSSFFVQVDPATRTVRFHYLAPGDTGLPTRALCYCIATKAWWEERYGQPLGHACIIGVGGKQRLVAGAQSGAIVSFGTTTSDVIAGGTTSIPYQVRTGNLILNDEPSRHVGVLYKPTATTSDLTLNMHYNGSSSARANAVQSDRGDSVISIQGGGAVIDQRSGRSALGVATGYAAARYAGRVDDRSSGGDRHVAVALSGVQQASPVSVYGVTIGGVTQ